MIGFVSWHIMFRNFLLPLFMTFFMILLTLADPITVDSIRERICKIKRKDTSYSKCTPKISFISENWSSMSPPTMFPFLRIILRSYRQLSRSWRLLVIYTFALQKERSARSLLWMIALLNDLIISGGPLRAFTPEHEISQPWDTALLTKIKMFAICYGHHFPSLSPTADLTDLRFLFGKFTAYYQNPFSFARLTFTVIISFLQYCEEICQQDGDECVYSVSILSQVTIL